MKKSYRIFAIPAVLAVTACTYNVDNDRYSARDVGIAQRVERGVLESYRYVELQTETGVGTTSGVVAGAAIGSTVGNGAEGILGALAGALIGGAIGNSVDRDIGRRKAFEYVVKLDNGHSVSIIQADNRPLPVGAPVTVRYGRRGRSLVALDETRIERSPETPPNTFQ